MTIRESVTSFANMILSANRIHKTIEQEESQTGQEYVGTKVIEKMPNGSTREAIVMTVEWCESCGSHGNYLLYIAYCDEKFLVPGAWVSKEVLTLAGGG